MRHKLQWTFETESRDNAISGAYATTEYATYYIDCWPKFFEVRRDGESVDKFDNLPDAIKCAENDNADIKYYLTTEIP